MKKNQSKHKEAAEEFVRLLNIMDELRAKCPWDKKQTMETLRYLTIEEMYELADSILEKNFSEIKKELGDLMLHIVFYAKIASEKKEFGMKEVLNSICEKLIARHPHIYGSVKVADEEEVKKNWEQLKLKEGKKSVLEGVPKSLPALVKAGRIQDKAKAVGFDWEKPEQVWEKVLEEINELKEAIKEKEKTNSLPLGEGQGGAIESEFGDVLFSLINFARFIGVNPENALEKTNKKFICRFQHLEKRAAGEGKKLSEMSLEEMDVYWNEAKEDKSSKLKGK